MTTTLLSLGLFVFVTGQTAIDEIRRKSSYRYASGAVVGIRPRLHYTGPENDDITLPGILYPELTDGPVTLDLLRQMAATGKSYALLGGDGTLYGLCKLTDIEETRTALLPDGTARKIEFSLTLKVQDDIDPDDIATLDSNSLGSLQAGSAIAAGNGDALV